VTTSNGYLLKSGTYARPRCYKHKHSNDASNSAVREEVEVVCLLCDRDLVERY